MKKQVQQRLRSLSLLASFSFLLWTQATQAQVTWTSRTSAADNTWASVTYGNGLFVAVSNDGTGNRVMTSPDGITWTSRTSAADNNWSSVTYGNGLFVAVASTGTGNRVMTSPDGITWTSRTSAADNNWSSVTYGNGLFVAVASTGTGNRVMTSPDGITWTSRTSAADNNWQSVTYGNGLFVAVANSGSGNRVMTSPDGITWTSRTSAADNRWFSVTYGNGLFVAVSINGTGNRVMTSPDGFTWTSRMPASDNNWVGITYGNGSFVAVGQGGAVMTSSDGFTWTNRTAPDITPRSVTYSNGLFVAVGNSLNTGNRVMTSPDACGPVTPTLSIAASPSGSITSGTSVTFTATPTNGGGSPSYQWKKNGTDAGTNSATYTDAALANNDVITCVLTSSDACASPTTAESNEITVTVTSPCTNSTTYTTTGAEQTFVVPTGVTSLNIVAKGGKGSDIGGSTGGLGGKVEATVAVTPGQIIYIYVGGAASSATGGYNGGGYGANSTAGGGGGSSDIRIGSNDLYSGRKLVAGGGGGAGNANGGAGGGLTGGNGGGTSGGEGATQSAGGNGGNDGYYGGNAGFNGYASDNNSYGGGAGGGGYYGGGGAGQSSNGNYGGGGGGSSYTDPSICTNVVHTQGDNNGNGSVVISYIGLTPSVSIAANPGNSITSGSSVTFTATPTNGGGSPSYQWKKNGTDAGTNSATYTDAALANNDVITCVMTSSDACASPTTATSNEITMTVTAGVNGPVCTAYTTYTTANGLSENFIGVSNGIFVEGANVYICSGNGLNISTNGGTNFSFKTTANGLASNGVQGVYASGATVFAATGNGLSQSTDGGNTFTTNASIGAVGAYGIAVSGSNVYVATTNGVAISTNNGATFTTTTIAGGVTSIAVSGSTVVAGGNGLYFSTNGGSSFTHLTTADGLATNSVLSVAVVGGTMYVALNDGFTGPINPVIPGGVDIITNNGTTITHKTTADGLGNSNVGGIQVLGTTVYAATNGGLSISTNGGSSFTNYTTSNTTGLAANFVKTVYVTSEKIYAGTSDGLSVCGACTPVTPSVSITANPSGSITTGTSVTFTATPTNGGGSPSYQWKKNGANVGTNSATYTNVGLFDGDLITCVMTSNDACASPTMAESNRITMTVCTPVTPSISIAANPGNSIITGTSVTFTATPTNGGGSPSYQWKKNNVNAGTNSATYTNAGLFSGDIITCVLTSNDACASPTMAESNRITMTVCTPPTAYHVTGGGSYCAGGAGEAVGLSNSESGVSYQLKKDGVNEGDVVSGTGSAISFGNQTAAGTYTVEATRTAGGCMAMMTGSATVTIKPTPTSALSASQTDVCPNTQVTLDAHCSIPTATVNWNPGAPTVTPDAATMPYIYKASCSADGCTGNESSVEVRTHRILVDMKDLDVGTLPLPIVRAVKDNMAPTNLIEAPLFPRRWTFIANGCDASESAVFTLAGPVNFSAIDNAATYAMFANEAGGFYSLDHPNYGNAGSFPNGTYTLTVDLRSRDGVGGPFPKNRVATGSLLATRTLHFTVVEPSPGTGRQGMAGSEQNEIASENEAFAQVMPNPVANTLHLKVRDAKDQKVNVSLLDASGRALLQRSFVPESNQHQEEFEVSHLSNGMYFLKVNTADKQTTLKVVKVQ